MSNNTNDKAGQIKKIWIAMSTPFQANFFSNLIQGLSNEFEFLVTAREHDNIRQILKAKNIPHISLGTHGGRELPDKLESYARNIQQMIPIIQREKPDLLLTERWPEAVRVAFGFNIPSWAIFYDEREKHVNQMVFPLASKVFSPRFYSFQELYQNGVTDPDKVMWFNGFHTAYLKGMPIDTVNPYQDLGMKPPVLFVRPEPEFASMFGNHRPVLEKAVETIAKNGHASVAVLPRTAEQMRRYSAMQNVTVLDRSVGDCPVLHADLALGAAETMLMEAFILGKPAVSAVYWPLSKPVIELHRYIPHSTDPAKIVEHTERYLDNDEMKAFKERASLIVKTMDNPVKVMMDEIRRLNGGPKEETELRRRSKLEIYIDIISAASLRPLRPTHIMKAANISYNELRAIVENLERKGLIQNEVTMGGKYFQATEEGLRLLQDYRGVKNRLLDS